MCFDMLHHVVSLNKSFIAVWALVLFVIMVDFPVPVQVVLVCKSFIALWALVWFIRVFLRILLLVGYLLA